MGRTNGKLVPYLRTALMYKKYVNLMLESNEDEFSLNLPRYNANINDNSEKFLKDWFRVTMRPYKGYSNGKSCIQAALKQSVFLMFLKKEKTKLFYKFATAAEIKENRRLKREKGKRSKCEFNPPSTSSSGYESSFSDYETSEYAGSPVRQRMNENNEPASPVSSEMDLACPSPQVEAAHDVNPVLDFSDLWLDEGESDEYSLATSFPSISLQDLPEELAKPPETDSQIDMNSENNMDLISYVTDESIPETTLSLPLNLNSRNSTGVYEGLSQAYQGVPPLGQNETGYIRNEDVIPTVSATSNIELIMRKNVWIFKEKRVFNPFVFYICELGTLESSNVEEITSCPDVIIPDALLEEGKMYKGAIPLDDKFCLIYG